MTSLFALGGMLGPAYLAGAIPSSIERLPPGIREWIGAEDPQHGTAFRTSFFGAWILAMPLAGWFADGSSNAAALGLGAFGMAISWAILAFRVPRRSETFFFGGLGFFCASLTIAVLATVPTLLNATDRNPEALCWAYVVIGAGVLTGPLLLARLEKMLGSRGALVALSIASAAPLLLLLGWEEPVRKTAEIEPWADPAFWIALVAFALYFPAETCLESRVGSVLGEWNGAATTPIVRLVVFWGMFLLGRFAFGFVRTGWEAAILALLAFVSAAMLGNVRGTSHVRSGTLWLWLAGLTFGPILPGLLGMLLSYYPDSPGLVLGVPLALSGLHHAFVEPKLAARAERMTPRDALRLPLGLLLVSSVPIFLAASLNPLPETPAVRGKTAETREADAHPQHGRLWRFIHRLRHGRAPVAEKKP